MFSFLVAALHHALAHRFALGRCRAALAGRELGCGFFHFLRPFPALDRAIATACFCGLPAFISVRMFAEMVLTDLPFFRGMMLLQKAQRHPTLADHAIPFKFRLIGPDLSVNECLTRSR